MAEEKVAEIVISDNDNSAGLKTTDAEHFVVQQISGVSKDAVITKVKFQLVKEGAPVGDVWAEIWDDDTAGSSHIIGVASAVKDASTITGVAVTYEFTWALGPSTTVAHGNYWIVIAADYATSVVNYLIVRVDSAGADMSFVSSPEDYTWDSTSNDVGLELYGIVADADTEDLLFASPFKNPFNTPIQGAT